MLGMLVPYEWAILPPIYCITASVLCLAVMMLPCADVTAAVIVLCCVSAAPLSPRAGLYERTSDDGTGLHT